ncbi:hypothetical protein C8R47DRAFT_1100989 [Mycena vitilis]|nr:hypothetical protein C8R47DRAFT_1100989 [Mycena vitilis]
MYQLNNTSRASLPSLASSTKTLAAPASKIFKLKFDPKVRATAIDEWERTINAIFKASQTNIPKVKKILKGKRSIWKLFLEGLSKVLSSRSERDDINPLRNNEKQIKRRILERMIEIEKGIDVEEFVKDPIVEKAIDAANARFEVISPLHKQSLWVTYSVLAIGSLTHTGKAQNIRMIALQVAILNYIRKEHAKQGFPQNWMQDWMTSLRLAFVNENTRLGYIWLLERCQDPRAA